jgi:hypothetical protein
MSRKITPLFVSLCLTRWSPHAVSGGPPFATIAVRRGDLVFVLGIPANKDAQAQLTSLTGLVLKLL